METCLLDVCDNNTYLNCQNFAAGVPCWLFDRASIIKQVAEYVYIIAAIRRVGDGEVRQEVELLLPLVCASHGYFWGNIRIKEQVSLINDAVSRYCKDVLDTTPYESQVYVVMGREVG